MQHMWQPHPTNSNYLVLNGAPDAMVRTKPMPDGRYLWQFHKVASYALTIQAAQDYVEAGAEFFRVMRRNPYG